MFRSLSILMSFGAVLLVTSGPAATAAPWPGSSTGTDLGAPLPTGFEPSGIVWDDFTGALWVVGGKGYLGRMLEDGTSPAYWTLSTGLDSDPDLESVAVTGTTQKLYLGEEYPPAIVEYDSSSTGAPTYASKSWSLSGLPATSSNGMEGLTWVPNGYHPYANSSSGGVFFASSQSNGTIYVYDVNLSVSNSTPALRGSFTPDAAQTDISDLYFSKQTRTLFVLYGAANKVVEVDTTTTSFSIMSSYTLPTSGTGQEGVTILPQCPGATTDIYLADDVQLAIRQFGSFPQLCATAYSPTADSTTKQTSPNTNYGTQTSLRVDSAANADENILIRFTLSGVNTAQINRARLLFYATDGTDLSPHYCATTSGWSETSVTWNNQPVCNSNNVGGGATVANNSWVSYNVLGATQAGWSSFRFMPQSTNDFVANSKEAASNRPQLILWMNQ